MKHLLPDLQSLVRRDFVVIEQKQWPNFAPDDDNRLVFIRRSTEQLGILSSHACRMARKYRLPLSELVMQHGSCIGGDHPWRMVEEKAAGNDYLLLLRGGRPLGYLKTNELVVPLLEAYRYLRAYFDTILNTTDGSISVIDEDLQTIVWTAGAERLFSIKKEAILGKPMTEFFPEKQLYNLRSIKTGEGVYHKQHQPRDDLFVLLNSNPVYVNGKIVGVVTCEKDVTDQVRLNAELTSAHQTIKKLQEKVSRINQSADPFRRIKGTSRAIRRTIDKVRQVGTIQARVLLQGESGVGKELFAEALHEMRAAKNAPFIAINCGAIPEALFESELFGYERGAFSGASSYGKKGKFELAEGGTLFLDEIGELALDMQVKLLRVLQEGSYYPVGGTKLKKANCFIIAATNKNLESLMKQGKFREDLFYRLNTVTITVPPLRERIDDVIELSQQFIYEFSNKYNRQVKEIPKEIMIDLLHYSWPGNIRELRNVIERLVIFAKDGKLDRSDLPANIRHREQNHQMALRLVPETWRQRSLEEAIKSCEERVIKATLRQTHKNKNKAADMLGISRATLYNKMKKLGIL
ncbi:MAG: sigma 54-interacting transcriptional regulator [Sporolactobacillus sp.]|jgi:PAS domain S-box-containing protein|nr:sigma 54-interacting transcriptional regulator [Sporolactobacillus sp.]